MQQLTSRALHPAVTNKQISIVSGVSEASVSQVFSGKKQSSVEILRSLCAGFAVIVRTHPGLIEGPTRLEVERLVRGLEPWFGDVLASPGEPVPLAHPVFVPPKSFDMINDFVSKGWSLQINGPPMSGRTTILRHLARQARLSHSEYLYLDLAAMTGEGEYAPKFLEVIDDEELPAEDRAQQLLEAGLNWANSTHLGSILILLDGVNAGPADRVHSVCRFAQWAQRVQLPDDRNQEAITVVSAGTSEGVSEARFLTTSRMHLASVGFPLLQIFPEHAAELAARNLPGARPDLVQAISDNCEHRLVGNRYLVHSLIHTTQHALALSGAARPGDGILELASSQFQGSLDRYMQRINKLAELDPRTFNQDRMRTFAEHPERGLEQVIDGFT